MKSTGRIRQSKSVRIPETPHGYFIDRKGVRRWGVKLMGDTDEQATETDN